MKILSKILCMLLCISMAVGVLASCDVALGGGDDDAYIEELDVNKKGELIVIFSDGEEENFGAFSPDGEEDGIVEISVSSKGKMTVKMANGKTKTVGYTYTEENEDDDEVIESVEINEDGELIVTRVDGSEENLGRVRDKDVLGGECTDHIDANVDGMCDKCGDDLSIICLHVDSNSDGKCDKCGTDINLSPTTSVLQLEIYGDSGWSHYKNLVEYFADDVIWEPGCVRVEYFRLTNNDSKAIDASLIIACGYESGFVNYAGETRYPSEFLKYSVIPNRNIEKNPFASREEALNAAKYNSTYVSEGFINHTETIESGDSIYLAVVVYMPAETGNEAQSTNGNYSIAFNANAVAKFDIGCLAHVDADKNGKCDFCGATVEVKPCVHTDFDRNGRCDKCGDNFYCTDHVDADRNERCDSCGQYVPYVWWNDITYDTTTLIFQMTHCSNGEELTSGCERYLAGDDHQGQSIDEMVARRNYDAYELTRVTVKYSYCDDIPSEYGWGKNVDRIYSDACSPTAKTPDMYCNFVHDLVCASLKGAFANVYSRGRGTGDQKGVNFLEIDDPGYMGDFMSSLTLSLDKIYVIASDYFIDLIRAFLIVPVNRSLFDTIANDMIEDLNNDGTSDINDFFEEIYNGGWTYERLAQYAGKVYQNTSSLNSGMDIQDTLGFVLTSNALHGTGLIYTSSVTIIHKEWNATRGDYDYYYPEENTDFYTLADAIDTMFSSDGVYYLNNSECTEPTALMQVRRQFCTNKLLFGGIIMLGSLEHYQYQSMKDADGFVVVPVPVYREGDMYLTHIHSVGRAGAISDATTKFAQCTAFMQYQSTHSTEILNEYYDYHLSYNVVEGIEGNVEILQYIRQNVRTSFDSVFEDAIGFFFESNHVDYVRNKWNVILVNSQYHLTNLREQYNNLYPTKRENLIKLSNYYNDLPD